MKSEQTLRLLATLLRNEQRALAVQLLLAFNHRIATPLNAISGRAALAILEANDRDAQQRHLEEVEQQVSRLAQVLHGLVDSFTVDTAVATPLPLCEIFATVLAVCKPLTKERRLRLDIEEPKATVIAPAGTALLEILLSLLLHALAVADAAQPIELRSGEGRGGATPELSLQLRYRGAPLPRARQLLLYDLPESAEQGFFDGLLTLSACAARARERGGSIETSPGPVLNIAWPACPTGPHV